MMNKTSRRKHKKHRHGKDLSDVEKALIIETKEATDAICKLRGGDPADLYINALKLLVGVLQILVVTMVDGDGE